MRISHQSLINLSFKYLTEQLKQPIRTNCLNHQQFCNIEQDLQYFVIHDKIKPRLEAIREDLSRTIKRIIKYVEPQFDPDQFPNSDSLLLNYDELQDTSQDLFERLNINIDKLQASIEKKNDNNSKLSTSQSIKQHLNNKDMCLEKDAIALKPQELFQNQAGSIQFQYIENSYNQFVPKLQFKFLLNSMPIIPSPEGYKNCKTVPIDAESLKIHNAFLQNPQEYSKISYSEQKLYKFNSSNIIHPYFTYLTKQFTPLTSMPNKQIHPYLFLDTVQTKSGVNIPIDPPPFRSLEETPFNWIDNLDDFNQILIPKLMIAKQLAIDLQHHSWRTYLGLTSLMQISTRQDDFIIDTLSLWGQIHHLAPIFANPNVVKVMHGADSDIMWLQRDFGIYIVNLFDTGRASRILQMKAHGFGYILQYYCGVKTDKKYQLADWRIRPLNDQMMLYARMDTHYLLYIYDRMRIDLYNSKKDDMAAVNTGGDYTFVSPRIIKKKQKEKERSKYSMMRNVWEVSKRTCLQVYAKPQLEDKAYQALIDRNRYLLDKRGMCMLKLLLKWRDFVARKLDENPHFILKNSVVFQIVKNLGGIDGCMYADLERVIRDGNCGLAQLGNQFSKAYCLDLFNKVNELTLNQRGQTMKGMKERVQDEQMKLPQSSSTFNMKASRENEVQKQEDDQDYEDVEGVKIQNLSQFYMRQQVRQQDLIKNTALYSLLNSKSKDIETSQFNSSLNDVIKNQMKRLQSIHGINLFEKLDRSSQNCQQSQQKLQTDLLIQQNIEQPINELIKFDELYELPASISEKKKKKQILAPRKAQENNKYEKVQKRKKKQTKATNHQQVLVEDQKTLQIFKQRADKFRQEAQKTMDDLKNSKQLNRSITEKNKQTRRTQKKLGKNIKAPHIFGSKNNIDKKMHFKK